MRLIASLKLRNLEGVKKFEKILEILSNIKFELDLTKFIVSEDFQKFIPLIASEIEDIFRDRISYIKVLKYQSKDVIERLLNLLDYLNVDRVILKVPEDVDHMVDIVDEASRYGVKTVWRFSKIESFETLSDIANSIAPYKLRIAIDVAGRRSVKDFTRELLMSSGYVEVIYLDNKDGSSRGLPIFHTSGKINFVKIFKILKCVGYDRDLVLNYRPRYYLDYVRDIELAESVISSVGSSVVDKFTKKLVEDVMREMMNL